MDQMKIPDDITSNETLSIFGRRVAMKSCTKEKLSKNPLGRVVLHGLCLFRGGDVRWHVAGISRELRNAIAGKN